MTTPSPSPRWLIGLASLVTSGMLLVMTGGCNGGSSGPLPDSIMVQALMEVHLIRSRSVYRDTEEISDSIWALQDSALIRRGISPDDFREMLNVYAEEPERYEAVYTSVVDSLNSLRVQITDATRDSVLLDSMIHSPPDNAYPPVE